jgi:hypothetical protein
MLLDLGPSWPVSVAAAARVFVLHMLLLCSPGTLVGAFVLAQGPALLCARAALVSGECIAGCLTACYSVTAGISAAQLAVTAFTLYDGFCCVCLNRLI